MIVVPFIEYMSVNTLVNWVIKSYTTADYSALKYDWSGIERWSLKRKKFCLNNLLTHA